MQRINGEAGQDTDMIHGVVPEGNDFSDTIFLFLGVDSTLDDEVPLIDLDVTQCPFSGSDKSSELVCHCHFTLCVLCPFSALAIRTGKTTGGAAEA